MKIIKKGSPPWWVGKVVTCHRCKCEVELEEADKPKFDHGLESLGEIVLCPNCSVAIRVEGNPVWDEKLNATFRTMREQIACDREADKLRSEIPI